MRMIHKFVWHKNTNLNAEVVLESLHADVETFAIHGPIIPWRFLSAILSRYRLKRDSAMKAEIPRVSWYRTDHVFDHV